MSNDIVSIAAQVDKLLAEADEENQYGGSEDSEGALHSGAVDFTKLRNDIAKLLSTPQPFPAPAVQDGELPKLPFSPYLIVDWSSGEKGKTMYDAGQMRDYARKAIAAQTAQAVPVARVTDGTEFGPGLAFLANGKNFPPVGTKFYTAPPTQAIAVEAWQPIETAPAGEEILVVATLYSKIYPEPQRVVAKKDSGNCWWAGPIPLSHVTKWMRLPEDEVQP